MIRFPSPDALDRNPELAPLALLAVAAVAARSALCSTQPKLRNLGDTAPEDARKDSTLGIALALVLAADVVEELVDGYRVAAEREHDDRRSRSYDLGF